MFISKCTHSCIINLVQSKLYKYWLWKKKNMQKKAINHMAREPLPNEGSASVGYHFVNLKRHACPEASSDCDNVARHAKGAAAVSVKPPIRAAATVCPSPSRPRAGADENLGAFSSCLTCSLSSGVQPLAQDDHGGKLTILRWDRLYTPGGVWAMLNESGVLNNMSFFRSPSFQIFTR